MVSPVSNVKQCVKSKNTKKNTSLYKKFLLKSMRLPEDILREISEYVFYDKETAIARSIKKNAMNSIENNVGPRVFDKEDWSFAINKKYFGASNCQMCGNYIRSNQLLTNYRLFCFCDRGLSEEDEEQEEDWDY